MDRASALVDLTTAINLEGTKFAVELFKNQKLLLPVQNDVAEAEVAVANTG